MDQQALTIRAVQWSPQAAAMLAEALPFADVEELQTQCENGAELFEVIAEQSRVGFYVLKVEQAPSYSEGVILAGCGSLRGVDLTAAIVPVIEKQFIGCRRLRIHTARPGLAKKLARMGYGAGEIILRKEL